MKFKHFSAMMVILPMTIIACDKISDFDRTVVVTTHHPPIQRYHFEVGLNETGTIANWDTTSEVTVTTKAKVGDVIYYLMSSGAVGSVLEITVDDVPKLSIDITGDSTNSAAGYLVID